MKKWYKHLIWAGKVETVECTDHHYTWSGRVPLTGTLKCMYCGKPIEKENHEN